MHARTRLRAAAVVVVAGAALILSAAAPALVSRGPQITPTSVGAVKLGESYGQLHAAHLIGAIRPGCEPAGPRARSARLLAPLRGSVNFSLSLPRRVEAIELTGGATDRGVGVGSTGAALTRAFPAAAFDHTTEVMFAITLVRIPKRGGGPFQFGLDTKTGRVTLVGVPNIPFCD